MSDVHAFDEQIDRLADEFEAAWKAGAPPQIAAYLPRIDEAGRAALLTELVHLDMEYRRRAGQPRGWEDYASEFPQLRHQTQVDTLADRAARRAQATAPTAGKPAAAPAPTPGHIPTAYPRIDGYHIIAKLGQGGMGAVYRATQLATKREVALKLMAGRALGSEKARRRFEREVELASSLEHPHIARVFDSGLAKNVYFYAMQLVPGVPLDKHVEMNQLGERAILELFLKVCRAVEFAHRKGVIHRDLKPSNVMVTPAPESEPFVLDFGLAKTLLDDGEHLTVSQEGDLTGTPAYMSPEQAAGHVHSVDTRSDVYSLGVILFRLLTSDHPHDLTGSAFELTRRIIEQEPKRPRNIKTNLDRDLEAILLKCLEKEPAKRYGSAGSLAEDIQKYLNHEPISAQPATATYFLKKKLARHKPLVVLTAVLFVVFNAAVGFYFWSIKAEQARTEKARQEAVTQEGIAKANEAKAVASEKQAEQERDRAKAESQRATTAEAATKAEAEATRLALYYTNVALANERFRAGDLGAARDLLGACPSDLRDWEWRYLTNLAADQSRYLIGHEAHVRAVTFSADSSVVASLDARHDVIVWDLLRAVPLARLGRDGGAATGLSFHPSGDRLAVTRQDRGIEIWNWRDKVKLSTLTAENETVYGGVWSPNGRWIASGTERGAVIFWDLEAPETPLKLEGGKARVQGIAFHPTEPRLVTCYGDGDRQIREWSLPAGAPGRSFGYAGGGTGFRSLQFSGDGKTIAANNNGFVMLFDDAGGRLLTSFLPPGEAGYGLSLNHDASRAATAGWDHTVRVTETASLRDIVLHRGIGHYAWMSPDQRWLLVFGAASEIQILSAELPSPSRLIGGGSHEGILAVSADGRRLIVRDFRAQSRELLVSSNGVRTARLAAPWNVRLARFSQDDKSVIGAGDEGRLITFDAHTGAVTTQSQLSGKTILSIHPTESILACADAARNLQLCDLDGRLLRDLRHEGAPTPVQSAFFSNNGRWLGSRHSDNAARVWDTQRGTAIWTMQNVQGDRVVPSPDGQRVATAGSRDSKIRLWSTGAGQLIGVSQDVGTVRCLAFDASGNRLFSGGHSQAVRVYDGNDLRPIITLNGHRTRIEHLAISPDGSAIFSSAVDETRRWGIEGRIHRPPDGPMDMLKLIDPNRDALDATTIREESGGLQLKALEGVGVGVVDIQVRGSYEIHAEFTRPHATGLVGLLLPAGTGRCALELDHPEAKLNGTALNLIDGKEWAKNPTFLPGMRLTAGKRHTLVARVSLHGNQAAISAELDGKPLLAWKGPQSSLDVWTGWLPLRRDAVGLAVAKGSVNWHALKLKMLDGEAWVPTNDPTDQSAVARGDLSATVKPGNVVDLLSLSSPERDAVQGDWKSQGPQIVSGSGLNVRLQIPCIPQGSYELSGAFTHQADSHVALLIPTRVSRGAVIFNVSEARRGKTASGIEVIKGDPVGFGANPATIWGKVASGQRHDFRVIVRQHKDEVDITAELDGKPLTRWRGPEADLSLDHSWETPQPERIGIGARNTAVTWHELKLKMLDGQAWVRPVEAAQPPGK